ncbi:MAG: hypothetical protein ACRDRK_03020 [Pseudonocardia sp.]
MTSSSNGARAGGGAVTTTTAANHPHDIVEVREPELTAAVRRALRRPHAAVGPWSAMPVAHPLGQPTTAGLFRFRGLAVDCTGVVPWSLFRKVIQSYRHWPLIDILPPELRDEAPAGTKWRYEADVYASDLSRVLPAGMRLPRVHRIEDLGDDRIALWMEDVVTLETRWDLPRFRRAARLLGRLDVRLTRADALPASASRIPGATTRLWHTGRVAIVLPALFADATWVHPLVAMAVDRRLRTDLVELAGRLPAVLDALDRLPHTLAHCDPSPQNLLVPADDPDGFVAIDWFLGGLVAVGYDLGQLLIGLAHSGELDPDELPAVHEAILTSYTAGLADEGMPVDEDLVRYGFDAAMVVRCAFTALPLELLDEPHPPTVEQAAEFTRRARLTRYLVDLGLALTS